MEYGEIKGFLMEAEFGMKQWQELKAICEIRMGNYSAQQAAKNQDKVAVSDQYTVLLYDRVVDIFQHEKISVAPYSVLKSVDAKTAKAVNTTATKLYQLACKWNSSKARQRNFTVGVFHMFVKLTISYLRDCRVPVSVKTVFQNADKFEGLVDRAFPGYVQAGLMNLAILGETALDSGT